MITLIDEGEMAINDGEYAKHQTFMVFFAGIAAVALVYRHHYFNLLVYFFKDSTCMCIRAQALFPSLNCTWENFKESVVYHKK